MRVTCPSPPQLEEGNGLSDSTYEFIATDSESQDGYITESAASSEFGSGGNTQDSGVDEDDVDDHDHNDNHDHNHNIIHDVNQDCTNSRDNSTNITNSNHDNGHTHHQDGSHSTHLPSGLVATPVTYPIVPDLTILHAVHDDEDVVQDDFVITVSPNLNIDSIQTTSPAPKKTICEQQPEDCDDHSGSVSDSSSDSPESSIQYTEQGLRIPSTKHAGKQKAEIATARGTGSLRQRLMRFFIGSTDSQPSIKQERGKKAEAQGLVKIARLNINKFRFEMWAHPLVLVLFVATILAEVALFTWLRSLAVPPLPIAPVPLIFHPAASTITVALTTTMTVRVPALATDASLFGFPRSANSPPVISSGAESPLCSVEVTPNREVLVRIPFSTKTSWLAKDLMLIEVYRAHERLKTKMSSTDDGILIELSKADAHGVVNVSIVTTRRPKINETFELNLGSTILNDMRLFRNLMVRNFLVHSKDLMSVQGQLAQAYDKTRIAASQIWNQSHHADQVDKASQHVREIGDQLTRQLDNLQNSLANTVLRAQVSSKLWWLAFQNKKEEHDEYEIKAKWFMARERDAERKARARREEVRSRRRSKTHELKQVQVQEAACLPMSFLQRRRSRYKEQKD